MFDISFGEIIIVLLVAALVLKKEDAVTLLRFFRRLRSQVYSLKDEVLSAIDPDSNHSAKTVAEVEDINLYLEKIIKLGYRYEGEYDLDTIKNYYLKLCKKQTSSKKQATTKKIKSLNHK